MDTFLSMLGNMNLSRGYTPVNRRTSDTTIKLFSRSNASSSQREKQSVELMNLPPELQTKILLYLPVESIKRARLVCSSWCDLIDTAREFSLIVNDRKFDYGKRQFPPWKITSCLIKYFCEHNDINFLPYPDALRKLSIWGAISKENFHLLISQAVNIEDLDLAGDFFTSNNDYWTIDGVKQNFNLDQLKKLTIFSNNNVVNHRENLAGICNQSMPNLTKLKITLEDLSFNRNIVVISPDEVTIMIRVIKFIAKLKKLKVLQISISPVVYSDEEWLADAVRRVHEEPNLEANLSRINLQICRLHVSPLYITLLRSLLAAQSNLKDIRIQSGFMEDVPVLYHNLENSLRSSVVTLGSIHIEWVSNFPLHPMTTINFRVFSQAQNLKRLVLKRWSGFSLGVNGMAKIINLNQLHQSIDHLTIEGFICSTEEIKAIAESSSFKLSEIRLIRVGMYGESVGVNGKATKAFCLKESLNSLSLGPLKNEVADIEDPEYQELRDMFKYDHFRSGTIVNFNLAQFRKKRESKRRREAQAEERRRMLCGCFQGN